MKPPCLNHAQIPFDALLLMNSSNRPPALDQPDLVMSDLGEKQFVQELLQKLDPDSRLVDGFGHDASILDIGLGDMNIAFKIDRASTPVTVSRGWSDKKAWGRLAVTANCSDLLASGAHPLAFMVCVCVPASWKVQDTEDVVFGCKEECEKNNVVFAGGDTKESAVPQVIGSAIGLSPKKSSVRRDTAKPGQHLVISGYAGGFMGAFLQLSRNGLVSPDLRQQWVHYLSHPVCNWREALFINSNRLASAAMDTSDGIYDALKSLTRGEIGISLNMTKVRFHPFARQCSQQLGIPLYNLMFGGADWNIVYAIDDEHYRLIQEANLLDIDLFKIGEFVAQPGIYAHDERDTYSVEGPINEQFRSRIEDMDSFMDSIITRQFFQPI